MLERLRATSQILEKTKPSTPLTTPWKPSSRLDLPLALLDRGASAQERQRQHAGCVDDFDRGPDGIGGDGAPIRVSLLPPLRDGTQGLAHDLPTLFEDLVSRHAGLLVSVSWRSTLRGAASRRSEEHRSELQSRENLVCRLL